MKTRIASALAAATLLLSPLAVGIQADASDTRLAPARHVGAKVIQVRRHLEMKGKVSDGYAHKLVYIEKKDCRAARCPWHGFAKVRTNGNSQYRHRVPAPQNGSWYFRAKVKASGGFAESYSKVWRTFRR
jgi:hypothetical protein